MTSYTLQVQARKQYTLQYSNERGPQGQPGSNASATTDASLLVSGTLADARLSSNVALENVANVFTAKQSFSGTTHVGLCLHSLTSAQYNALTPANGDVFVDSTTNRVDVRLNGVTEELIDTRGGQTINGNLAATTLMIGGSSGPLLRNNAGTIGARTNNNGADAPFACSNLTASGTGSFATNVLLANSAGFRFSSTADPSGVSDSGIIRGGSSLIDVLATNGVRFRNGNNTADAPITCSNLTASGTVLATSSGNSGRLEVQNGTSGNLILLGSSSTGNVTINNANTVGGAIDLQSRGITALSISNAGNLTASGTVRIGTYTVGTLPGAAANTRARAFVTDSNLAFNSTNLGSTVTAGGAILVPVFSNGTNWVIG